jgi:hypothetical protein
MLLLQSMAALGNSSALEPFGLWCVYRRVRNLAAESTRRAEAVCVCGLRRVSEAPKTWGRYSTVTRASVLGLDPTWLVSGWRFAPPCCAGQSVCRPLRPHGAFLHSRAVVGRHQDHSSTLVLSTRTTGRLRLLRKAARFPVHRSGCSICPAPPLLPNPSVNRRANGMPPSPGRRYAVHFRQPGLGVLPLSPGYLER